MSDPVVKKEISPGSLARALDYRSGIGLSTFFVDSILKRQTPKRTRKAR
jgi:hypothetical protein